MWAKSAACTVPANIVPATMAGTRQTCSEERGFQRAKTSPAFKGHGFSRAERARENFVGL
jgi:hypothetical protein